MPILEGALPEPLEQIHIMGICGTAMGALAGMLQDAGYRITGSDTAAYPPMGEILAGLGIEVMEGYRAENLRDYDLVVVGNVIRAVYEEAQALVESDLSYCSFPQLLGELFLKEATSIVVAGTHGKTTTSAICSWLAAAAGLDPGYLVGGVVKGLERSAVSGGGDLFILEGDEYDTAFFDKGPKFLHYRANTAILSSVEFDHADIFEDLNSVKDCFRKLVSTMPADGLLIARWDLPDVREVCADAPCEIWRYGRGQDWEGRILEVDTQAGTMTFEVLREGQVLGCYTSSLVGEHNLYNQVAAVAALVREGVEPEKLADGFQSFQGIRRRQEILGEPGGISVVDDFAHHPTAVSKTLEALRLRFGGRRIWAIFEPRSATSRRSIFQEDYAAAFDAADLVVIAATADMSGIDKEEQMDCSALTASLRARGIEAVSLDSVDQVVATLAANAMEGDVLALLSNGGFDGAHEKLLNALGRRFSGESQSSR